MFSIILRILDLWDGFCMRLRKLYLFLAAILCVCRRNTSTRIIYASIVLTDHIDMSTDCAVGTDVVDITNIISMYYATDRILSCASMERWLSRWYSHFEYGDVTIVYVENGVIKSSQLNLEKDLETYTQTYTCDTAIDKLPHRLLV